MQNISSLKESRVHCGHEDTFSSTRRPRTREEFGSKVGRIISDSNVDGGYMPKLRRAQRAGRAGLEAPPLRARNFLNFSHPESHKSLTNLCLTHMLSRVCKKP